MLCSTTEEPSAHTARRKTTPRSNTLARGHLNKTHEIVCKINVFGYKYGGRGQCTPANHHPPPRPSQRSFPAPARSSARGVASTEGAGPPQRGAGPGRPLAAARSGGSGSAALPRQAPRGPLPGTMSATGDRAQRGLSLPVEPTGPLSVGTSE